MARVRDRSAWERLAELYHPLVARWCRRAGLSDADDVRQEVILAVAAGLGAFETGVPKGVARDVPTAGARPRKIIVTDIRVHIG
jgi:hypothetical protein